MKAQKEQKRGRGRPQKFKENERWGRTTVILRDWEIASLDRLAADIREKSGLAMNRSDLIRESIGILFSTHEEGRLKVEKLENHGISAQITALIHQGAKR